MDYNMQDDFCKNLNMCPIYSGVLKNRDFSIQAYKKIYCEAGPSGWQKCKRYQMKKKIGKCPPDLLPNAPEDIDEIIREMKLTDNT